MKNQISDHAFVAKCIRAELKEKYPQVKFSVRGKSFAGGDSVDIYYTIADKSYPTEKDIGNITNKHGIAGGSC